MTNSDIRQLIEAKRQEIAMLQYKPLGMPIGQMRNRLLEEIASLETQLQSEDA